MLETICVKKGVRLLAWREVPTNPSVLGKKALDCMPGIMQAFFARPADCEKGLDFDRRLYILRREFEQSHEDTYVCSMSSRTIVYKGMFLVKQLAPVLSGSCRIPGLRVRHCHGTLPVFLPTPIP